MAFPNQTLSSPTGAQAGVCGEPRQDAAKYAIKQNSDKFKDLRGQFLPPDRAHLFGAILFGAPRPANCCKLVPTNFVQVLASARLRRSGGGLSEFRPCGLQGL